MNKTKIEWTNYTWNPVTGCWGPGGTAEKPNRCAYCYAEKVARRFKVPITAPFDDPFAPRYHQRERLDQPTRVKKPSKIFLCSMADLFGDWVPTQWIAEILQTVRACPYHTFQFLTKNPKRLKQMNPWPSNCWVGTTVTNQADADERIPWLLQVDAPVRFVSHEPLLGLIFLQSLNHDYLRNPPVPAWENRDGDFRHTHGIDWAIIGAMTGPGAVEPKMEWVVNLKMQYQNAGVPVFLKDNLGLLHPTQEWPA